MESNLRGGQQQLEDLNVSTNGKKMLLLYTGFMVPG